MTLAATVRLLHPSYKHASTTSARPRMKPDRRHPGSSCRRWPIIFVAWLQDRGRAATFREDRAELLIRQAAHYGLHTRSSAQSSTACMVSFYGIIAAVELQRSLHLCEYGPVLCQALAIEWRSLSWCLLDLNCSEPALFPTIAPGLAMERGVLYTNPVLAFSYWCLSNGILAGGMLASGSC